MPYKQHPPFCVKIELTEGCNLRCHFCGINGIRKEHDRTFLFMPVGIAARVGEQLATAGWRSRIEFSGRGEPTKNPYLLEIVQCLRKWLPRNNFMITTNGSGFLASSTKEVLHKLHSLFSAGMDTIALDEYRNVPWANMVRAAVQSSHYVKGFRVYEYPTERAGNPHRRNKLGEERLVFVAPVDEAVEGTHSYLNNHCGAAAPLDYTMVNKRCARPFREIVVRFDGRVALCCNDWRGEFKAGDTAEQSVAAIWRGAPFTAARRKLLHYRRDFRPCHGCNATSYRVGLLPDPMGKETLPRPSWECKRIIEEALRGGGYTTPVLRPWEIFPEGELTTK